jgi:hypothetical protein
VKRVQQDRKLKTASAWGDFCSVSSAKDDEVVERRQRGVAKVLNDEEIRSVINPVHTNRIVNKIPASSAPLLGPARRLGSLEFALTASF